MKASDLIETAKCLLPAGLNMMLTGIPGVGKTAIVKKIAEQLGWDLLVFHPAISDAIDFKGMPMLVEREITAEDGTRRKVKEADFLPFNDLRQVLRADTETLVLFDDYAHAVKTVQGATMQLFHGGKLNGFEIPSCVHFMAATNRRQDKAGVDMIIEPVKGRFMIFQMDVDVDDWIRWALTEGGMPMTLVQFIRFRPNLLCDFKPTAEIVNSPTPRTVEFLGRTINAGLPEHLQPESFAGAVGEAFAAEYIGFLRLLGKIPNPVHVLQRPNTAPVPDMNDPEGPATLWALCGALIERVTDTSIDRLVHYAERLPDEFNLKLITDALVAKPELYQTRAIEGWASAHPELSN